MIRRAFFLLACMTRPAAAHGQHFTQDEIAWLNRQVAVDGMKCCDETDAHVGTRVSWRIEGSRYQVRIQGAWHDVPPGRVMRSQPDDPSPWGGEALLFYSPRTGGGISLWCFRPEALH